MYDGKPVGRLTVATFDAQLGIDYRVISDKSMGNCMSLTFQRVNQGSSVSVVRIYDDLPRKYERKDFNHPWPDPARNFVPS